MTAARAAAVVVLGELDRSRRMLRHANELVRHGWDVTLIGFRGTPLPSWVDPRIVVRPVRGFESVRGGSSAVRFLTAALLRQFLLGFALSRALMGRFDAVLVQVPPAFPTLPLILGAARLRKATVIVDWHNTTEAMLRLRIPGARWIARACGRWELRLGRRAAAHLAATAELGAHLHEGGVRAAVLPDIVDDVACASLPHGRFVVSPSSWSADDDLELFLRALPLLEDRLAARDLRAHFVFSGEGERRAWFESQIAAMHLDRVHVETTFVSPDDYPRLLETAALGLSLHRSADGLDLPLKIVELLANGTPVCALDSGAAIRARIREGETGVLFGSSEEMAAKVSMLLDPGNPLLERMRANVAAEPRGSWAEAWERVAGPLFD